MQNRRRIIIHFRAAGRRVTFSMKGNVRFDANPSWDSQAQPVGITGASPSCALHLVSRYEVKQLRDALERGEVPFDLQSKLLKLERGGVIHHFVQQYSQLIIALLQAAHDGEFRSVTTAECERLRRILAYVWKDDDLIPDYQPGGYTDDHQVVRAAIQDLAPLMHRFKLWRLRHQVPAMWLSHGGEPAMAEASSRGARHDGARGGLSGWSQ